MLVRMAPWSENCRTTSNILGTEPSYGSGGMGGGHPPPMGYP